ncbi:dihydrofolate reductase [Lacihabitans soyangensis]|uniref:Dihydrofolate reductase n=1 Tax=Lacihabitans soyangensis TaxID=869394 RepID=A0AAE3KTI4_9BACT|nr:dihydrofolate reductase [Lacihabitans soyangensis]MCP9764108.1 dihydrofolate reductase [Lacihabitans soyangensis]
MDISIIVAVAENGVIGKDNQLLWRLSEDLKLFKKRTSHHVVIMGRKTYDSIGKPLPNRLNIVISRSKDLKIEGCTVANTLQDAIEIAKNESDKDEVFIIGGEKIYTLAENLATKLYLTKVNASLEGDAFFNLKPYENWRTISSVSYFKDEKNEYDFEVLEIIRA